VERSSGDSFIQGEQKKGSLEGGGELTVGRVEKTSELEAENGSHLLAMQKMNQGEWLKEDIKLLK
jgi:hypothetical protein